MVGEWYLCSSNRRVRSHRGGVCQGRGGAPGAVESAKEGVVLQTGSTREGVVLQTGSAREGVVLQRVGHTYEEQGGSESRGLLVNTIQTSGSRPTP